MDTRIIIIMAAVLALSFAAMWGCDALKEAAEDEAKDQVDTSFEKDVTMELEAIPASGGEESQTLDQDCGTTSVEAELEKHDIDEDDVDIESITLQFVEASYREATWEPPEVGSVTCTLTMTGEIGTVTITEESVVKGSSDWVDINVSDDALAFINYYLANRSEEFSYCAECTDADSYYVEWLVRIGVTVKGEASG